MNDLKSPPRFGSPVNGNKLIFVAPKPERTSSASMGNPQSFLSQAAQKEQEERVPRQSMLRRTTFSKKDQNKSASEF